MTFESFATVNSRVERMGLQVAFLGPEAYAVGGFDYNAAECSRRISRVNRDGTETVLPVQLSVGRNHFLTKQVDADRFLVIGGYSEDFGTLADVECVNVTTNTVEAWPWLKEQVELAALADDVGNPDFVAVIGGLTAQGETKAHTEIQLINLKNKEVTLPKAHLHVGRFGHACFTSANLVYVVGGKSTGRAIKADGTKTTIYAALDTIEEWNPNLDTDKIVGRMAHRRDRPAVAKCPDGTYLIIGGSDGTNMLDSIEVFDPLKHACREVGHLKVPRMAAKVLAYPTGVVVLGGWTDKAEAGREIEFIPFDMPGGKATVLPAGRLASSRAEGAICDGSDGFWFIGGKDMFNGRAPSSYSFTTNEEIRIKPQ